MKHLVLVVMVLALMLGGCATTPQREMGWVPVTHTGSHFDQDKYQCQQEAGMSPGASSQTGTATQAKFKECLESKGYSLEDKEMFENKEAKRKKLSDECPAKIGIILSMSDIAPPKIIEIDPHGAASKAGLEKGDLITKINGSEVKSSVQGLQLVYVTVKPGVPVEFSITRNGVPKVFTVIPEKK